MCVGSSPAPCPAKGEPSLKVPSQKGNGGYQGRYSAGKVAGRMA
eukprot:CAMPEP_0119056202 /NCGR_PEP_ID=MMETSP1178-20130426/908_1 /TAXON_ID=33656 /ORGANISM="unid sp, Strain CCMP2000" /LENGTH=43 /DNA_ID= /DNA_START= /DNA_END= /DNA_ORIENTATION=